MRILMIVLNVLLMVASMFLVACSKPNAPAALRVYAHDSFVGKYALGPVVQAEFTRVCGVGALEWVVAGDAGKLLQRLEVDRLRGKYTAQVVLGFDQLQWQSFAPFIEAVPEVIQAGELGLEARSVPLAQGFVPYDFGVFGWIADTEALAKAKLPLPSRWEELVEARWKRKLILEDPRTSTPGFAALLTVNELLGAQSGEFWAKLRASWLTLTPGWDEAYGLFLKEQAPLVWSYTTSEAYHRSEGSSRYRALLLNDVGLTQVEGAGLLRGTSPKEREAGQCFLRVLVSPAIQAAIPTHQWMWPVRQGTPLPDSFRAVVRPKRTLSLSLTPEERTARISKWREAF